MALVQMSQTYQTRFNTATGNLHLVSITGAGVETDLGAITQKVSGITFDAGVDIGDINLLNIAGSKVNPATSDLQTTGNGILTTMDADTGAIKTNTDTLVTAGGGGYVRLA